MKKQYIHKCKYCKKMKTFHSRKCIIKWLKEEGFGVTI